MGQDPGITGAMAVLDDAGNVLDVTAMRPNMTDVEAVAVAVHYCKTYPLLASFCEKVGYIGKKGDRKTGDGGKGAFTFGDVTGLIRGAILARGVKVYRPRPAIWQMHMGCLTGGNKNVSKEKAIELFPHTKMTHSIADALLIAEHGRRRLLERMDAQKNPPA